MAAQQSPDDSFTHSDAEIIQAVLSGNTGEFRFLMERHQQAIFGYLYRLLNQNTDGSQDLTQAVFLKAYQNLASFDQKRPFTPWLYRIAHNEAANHLRTRARQREVGMDEPILAGLMAPAGESPEAVQAERDDSRLVNRALERLKPKYREALQLYYFEDKSYEEIAAIMATSVGTVGTLIRRGRKQMEALLAPANFRLTETK